MLGREGHVACIIVSVLQPRGRACKQGGRTACKESGLYATRTREGTGGRKTAQSGGTVGREA